VLGGVSWWLVVSKYDFGWYLEAWLIGAFGIAFINISLVMLLSVPLGNRRIAVVLAIFFCYAFPMLISFEPTANWLDLLNPIRPGIFFRYAGIMDPAPEMLPLALTLIGGAVQVIIVGILVTWWLRNHEA